MINLQQLFDFEGHSVRIAGTDEQPEWIAQDVCKVLGISDYKQALEKLDEDEKGIGIISTPGGNQEMLTVNESGLYHLIFKSRKESAKRFRKWVTAEVLPAIRRTGRYEFPELQMRRLRVVNGLIQLKEKFGELRPLFGHLEDMEFMNTCTDLLDLTQGLGGFPQIPVEDAESFLESLQLMIETQNNSHFADLRSALERSGLYRGKQLKPTP